MDIKANFLIVLIVAMVKAFIFKQVIELKQSLIHFPRILVLSGVLTVLYVSRKFPMTGFHAEILDFVLMFISKIHV